jgi:molybdopterin/thiamine biosynthesis adenylyltransferase
MESTLKLNEGEFKVYDRQLRLWGIEAQKRYPVIFP